MMQVTVLLITPFLPDENCFKTWVLLRKHLMQLPPGPPYLLRSFPYFAVSSTIVYACQTLAKKYLSLDVPTWLTVSAVILARPGIFFFNQYYSRFADRRDAAANNAVLPPYARESAFSIVSKITESFTKGYPGAY